jgi:hypothetical protein
MKTDKVETLKMTYDEWEEKFLPLMCDEHPVTLQPYGNDLNFINSVDPQYVWTMVDVDGVDYIVEGRRFVNRVHYYISRIAWDADTFYEVSD